MVIFLPRMNARGMLPAAYSLCCPIQGGTPCPDLTRGYPVSPQEGTWDQSLGTPPKDMGPVEVLWDGNRVPPVKGPGTSGSIMGWR